MSIAFHEPSDLESAVELLERHGDDAMVLAGGTSFSLFLKAGFAPPGHVVGLGRIEALRGIRREEGGLWIGAHVTHHEVAGSSLVGSLHPMMAAAFGAIASVRVRTQATIGGNLAHADPSQDPPPVLMALDASIHVVGPAGTRRIPSARFFLDYFATALGPGEIITGVSVPDAPRGSKATYLKFLPRTADDYAVVSVAAAAVLDADGTVGSCRVALGGAAPTPVRASSVESSIEGRRPDDAILARAAASVDGDIQPVNDIRASAAYRRAMAAVFVERALREVTAVGQ